MDEISLDESDTQFKHMLFAQWGGETLLGCFACQTCTASCPISPVQPVFQPHRIMRRALLGLKNRVIRDPLIWLCTSCYSCQERCPQGVRVTELLTFFKNLATAEGLAPQGLRAQLDLIKTHGRVYPIDDFDNKKREKAGLPTLPTRCASVQELLGSLEPGNPKGSATAEKE